jgi:hypothetical protein
MIYYQLQAPNSHFKPSDFTPPLPANRRLESPKGDFKPSGLLSVSTTFNFKPSTFNFQLPLTQVDAAI